MATRVGNPCPIPVAQYLRMSTEHQRYSTANQRDAIDRFARERGMEVVKTYEDSGKSGLTLADRPGLQQLLADVCSANREFKAIVVFDISRWGRFQDADESAHYEFLCRRSGVEVLYSAEPFGDVTGPMAAVFKSVKRAMAAEYSRELGDKVLAGQRRLAKRGFKMGGRPAFGLRRLLVTEDGSFKGELQRHERKSIATDRVVFAPGDPLKVYVIRAAFSMCADGIHETDIVRALNWAGWPGRDEVSPWSIATIRRVLRNEYYVGTLVFNRRTCRLRTPIRFNSPDMWVRAPNSFEGIVSRELFDRANAQLDSRRPHRWTTEELLTIVRRIYASRGTVTVRIIDAETGRKPAGAIYIARFGSIADACEAAGIPPSAHASHRRGRTTRWRRVKLRLLQQLAEMYQRRGIGFFWSPRTRRACFENGYSVSVKPVQASDHLCEHAYQWDFRADRQVLVGPTIAARLEPDGDRVLDYYVIPGYERRRIIINQKGQPSRKWIVRYKADDLESVVRKIERMRRTATSQDNVHGPLARCRRMAQGIQRQNDPHYLAHRLTG